MPGAGPCVARHLAGRAGLVAVDLRGRGLSHELGGPFGIHRHADDIAAIIHRLNAAPCVVAGHGLGATVALDAAERHPAAVAAIVLVDGGPPDPLGADTAADRDDIDTDALLDAQLGSAMTRLQSDWPDRVSYRALWAEHPGFVGIFTPEVERYALSDLVERGDGFRVRVDEQAVRYDGAQLLRDVHVRGLLERCWHRARIVRAETGRNGAPPPLIDEATVEAYPRHLWRTVPGANHFSVLLGEAGAEAVAEEMLAAAGVNGPSHPV